MEIIYEHNFGMSETYEKVNGLLKKLQEQYSKEIECISKKWNKNKDAMNFSMKISGFNIGGDIYLDDKKIIFDANLPFFARMFKGKIEGMIRKELDKVFC